MSANLAILLTPPGTAAIAVVRLVGPGVKGLLAQHFSKALTPGRCVHGDLTEDSRVIDDSVIVLCDERTADLNVHGGPWVLRSTLDLARRHGFEVLVGHDQPTPPEAFDADVDLEREVLSFLPMARTEVGVRALLAQPKSWQRFVERAAANPEDLGLELRRIFADSTLEHLLHPPTVAIVGSPNVGKSTLANQLFAVERSITADFPGTTRDWVGEIANVNGLPIMLLDTPGIRTTDDAIEQTSIERSRDEIQRADQVVLVLDASRPLEGEQSRLMDEYPQAIRVVNKWDRSEGWQGPLISDLPTVATTGEGVESLRRTLVRKFCGQDDISIDLPRCWTSRQRAVVERAIDDPRHLSSMNR